MKRFLIVEILCIFSILQSKAQSDFRDGYIIKNNNDTIHCLIDYKGNMANAKKCVCQLTDGSDARVFEPEEIKCYRFLDSKYYVSKSVVTANKTKQLFLEYLINGIVDVYYYRDNYGEHYLIDNGTGELYELKNEKKQVVIDGKTYVEEKEEYKGVLRAVFRESPVVVNEVSGINLGHKSLIKITEDYHNAVCSDGECIIYEKKLPKIRQTYGVVIGVNGISFSEMVEFAAEHYYLGNNGFKFRFYPSIGLFYELNMPFINERLYFQYEGTYSRMNMQMSTTYNSSISYRSYINDISYTQNGINNLFSVKYKFPKGKVRPTVQVGGFFDYFFSVEYGRELEVKYPVSEQSFWYNYNDNPFEKYDVGINLGLGFVRKYQKGKELFLDFRYQRGFGFLEELNTNTYSIVLGLQLGKIV